MLQRISSLPNLKSNNDTHKQQNNTKSKMDDSAISSSTHFSTDGASNDKIRKR